MTVLKIAIYDKTTGSGKIISRGRVSADSVEANTGENEFYLNCPDDATHIIDNEPATLPPDIESLKVIARSEIKSRRDLEEQLPFEYLGKMFDADEKSIKRLTLASQAAQSAILAGQTFEVTWTCADNSTITLDQNQMLGVLGAMMLRGVGLHERCRELKNIIDAATNIEEIATVKW